jgi:2-methylcitrate dehydratase PrpD
MSMPDPTTRVARHILSTRFEDIPPAAVERMKTFLIDTIGVGLAGSSGAQIDELKETARSWGDAPEATVWLTGERMSAQSAAIVNGYQIHCLEYDCVHEGAVLHPMATILSSVFAWVEREKTKGRVFAGRDLLTALILGIDVSTMLGIVTDAPLRFFRPATAGGFGAAAAIAKLSGFDETEIKNVLGAQYSQASGTLQAHFEGTPMLGLQVGFNSRAAIVSADLTKAGFRAPHDVFTGRYGYLVLFEENNYEIEPFLDRLGQDWQILEMAHKPFPSGRLTHGTIDGLTRLMRDNGVAPSEIARVHARVPPLVHRLVGRPDIPHPEPNYAKLCLPFVVGVYLSRGHVDVPDFLGREMLDDPIAHGIAATVTVEQDDNPDLNAFTPQTISIGLKDGREFSLTLHSVYGDPRMPLTDEENIEKFMRCRGFGRYRLEDDRAEALVDAISTIESLDDVALIPRMTLLGDRL